MNGNMPGIIVTRKNVNCTGCEFEALHNTESSVQVTRYDQRCDRLRRLDSLARRFFAWLLCLCLDRQ